ncbi:MAG: DUF4065 domain-containing protein [Thermoplasmata archaeon]|jgi:uncharacterized phage-associated protein|nr:DUF4065 domain-containing protein [Thermoplasmata archaeon]
MRSYTAQEVAEYVIERCIIKENRIDNLKLQKILFFVWMDYYKKTGRELFKEQFEAWECGPVVYSVYAKYKSFKDQQILPGSKTNLDEKDCTVLAPLIDKYARLKGTDLVRKSHVKNGPWDQVYEYGEKHILIDKESMKKYIDPIGYAEDERDLETIRDITSDPNYKSQCVDSDEFFNLNSAK